MTNLSPLILLAIILCFTGISCKPYKHRKREILEGDIILTRQQRDSIFSTKKNNKRNFIKGNQYKWPTKNGFVEVPYEFKSGVSESFERMYKAGVNIYNRLTCIRFVPRANQKDYLEISPTGGCSSYVGRVGGKQPVFLGSNCQSLGHVLHENMHALGFYHEQSRPDRDEHVQINWDNIQDGFEDQFEKYTNAQGLSGADLSKFPYDTDSIMHYEKIAFSKGSGKPTIIDKENPNEKVGQLKFFSTGDLFKINTIYGCAEKYTKAKKYKFMIRTSNDWFSGTDAKVFMKIYGADGKDSGEIELKQGNFEAGDVDVEYHLLPDETPIQKIVIWHDNTGYGASWKPEEVTIEDTKSKETTTFVCNKWLEGDASENRVTLT